MVFLTVLSAKRPFESLPEEKKLSKGRKDSDQINKYRELLKSIQDKEKKKDDNMDMEITWVPGITVRLGLKKIYPLQQHGSLRLGHGVHFPRYKHTLERCMINFVFRTEGKD